MKRYIRSDSTSEISVKQFIDNLVAVYHKKFPDSKCLAPLHYINEMAITLKPLLCADISDVGHSYFGNIADPFNIEMDIAFPNTSRGEIDLDTQIDLQYIFHVQIRCFTMETGRLFYDEYIQFPESASHGYYSGNYNSVISFWEQFVDNIYNTFMQLKKENNLPDYIEKNPGLKAVVDNL